ncbi:oligosaccharide flippase family protein [Thalassotalea piscium]|uniref:O-antigen/teichoic acid export membrane protein n=1 Tax=Thalassotalea piscium TaxID=1230533 RepID=A0A7X0NFY9_9GAMM|nr:oligosaccharide flippase family protein [Thalassotalea piscium]MBB6542756.1 O-antigen/teichoic acid export membrane protein [Thalassotalea piscium]
MLKAISSVLLFRVLAAFLGFVTVTLITRYSATTEDAGLYFFMVSLLTIMATIARVGCDNAVTRYIAIANKAINKSELVLTYQFLITRTIKFAVLFSGGILLLGWLGFYITFISYNYAIAFTFTAILIPFINVSVVFVQCFQGLKSMHTYAFLNTLTRIVLVFLLMLAVMVVPVINFSGLALMYGVSIILTAIISYWLWRRKLPVLTTATELSAKQDILTSSYLLWGVAVLATIMTNGATVILGFLSSPEQVAIFAATSRIALILTFILMAANSVLSPRFAELSKEIHLGNTRLKLQDVYRSSTRLMILLTLPLLVIVFSFAKDILLVFGEAYTAGSLTLRLLVVGLFFKTVVGSVGQLLIMTGHEKEQRLSLIIAVTLLVLLLVCLTPTYGALGAATAVLIAMVMNNSIGYYFVVKKLKVSLF